MAQQQFYFFLLGVLALGFGLLLWLRYRNDRSDWKDRIRRKGRVEEATHSRGRLAASVSDEAPIDAAGRALQAPPFNPLSVLTNLTLDQAIDARRFGEAIEENWRREPTFTINRAGDTIAVALNFHDAVTSGSRLTFEVTRQTQLGLATDALKFARDGNGKLLPTVRDPRTGRFDSMLRGASTSGVRLAAVSAMLIGIAHLVSGRDLADKLGEVSAKVDMLLAGRRIDQIARLERIYKEVKELAMRPSAAANREHMYRLRHDLSELRSTWHGEVEHALNALRDLPKVGVRRKALPWTRRRHAEFSRRLGDEARRVQLMEFTLRLELLLALAGDDVDPFFGALADELGRWESLGELFETKSRTISVGDLTAQPYVVLVRGVAQHYREQIEPYQALRGYTPPHPTLEDNRADR